MSLDDPVDGRLILRAGPADDLANFCRPLTLVQLCQLLQHRIGKPIPCSVGLFLVLPTLALTIHGLDFLGAFDKFPEHRLVALVATLGPFSRRGKVVAGPRFLFLIATATVEVPGLQLPARPWRGQRRR